MDPQNWSSSVLAHLFLGSLQHKAKQAQEEEEEEDEWFASSYRQVDSSDSSAIYDFTQTD